MNNSWATNSSVSIAMCTYNGRRHITSQLDSFLSQERLPSQLVVCDDGSQDGTQEILKAFARTAPFSVELHFNVQRLGITRNFDQALAACTGDFIALSDQDDTWHPSKLRRLSELLELNPYAGYACSDAELIGDDGSALGSRLFEQLRMSPVSLLEQGSESAGREMILHCNFITGATMVIRKSLYQLITPIPATWGHDYWMAVLSEILGYHGVTICDLLTRYRVHHGQACGVPNFGRFHNRPNAEARQNRREERVQGIQDLLDRLANRLLAIHPEAARWLPIVGQALRSAERTVEDYKRPWFRRTWSRFTRLCAETAATTCGVRKVQSQGGA